MTIEKKAVAAGFVLLFCIATIPVFSESYYFIDGFELNVPDRYHIEILDPGNETELVIYSPERDGVHGEVIYMEEKWNMPFKDIILLQARSAYGTNMYGDYEEVSIYSSMEVQDLKAFWVYSVFDDFQYPVFAIDLRDSPGFAHSMLLYANDSSLSQDEMENVLLEVIENMRIDFMEAAG